ncbi:MAG: hypothetical protein Q8P61_07685, partial [Candidatus Nanopelagicales bacterium]|nr:hypothetical protein [Candidatus Nanopelagicales bacterium]
MPGTSVVRKSMPRLAAALALVWVLSFAAYPLHLTGVVALAWLVAAVVLLPVGERVADRLIALVVIAAAIITLVAWISPFVPLLLHPVLLTGALGTVPAVWWARGRGRAPVAGASDWVALGSGVIGGLLWWFPLRAASTAGLVDALFFAPDTAAHVTMLRGVWEHHGYEIVNTGAPVSAYIWQSYPEGTHALLSTLGSVITGSASAPDVEISLRVYALLLAAQAGFLAFVLAWAVARLTGRAALGHGKLLTIAQVIPGLFLVIGPGAWILMSSLSFVTGIIMAISGAVIATTSRGHPRLGALLVGAALVALSAAYPLLAVFAPPIWVIFIWVTRSFWLRHRLAALVMTVGVALACSPMFFLLVLRDVSHGLGTPGVFEPIPIVVFVAVAWALGIALIAGPRWLPRPIARLAWLAAVVTFLWVLMAIVNRLQLDRVQYYTAKSMYASLLLAVAVICAIVVVVASGWQPVRPLRRKPWPQRLAAFFSVAFMGTSIAAGVLLVTVKESPLPSNWYRAIPGAMWIGGQTASHGGGEWLTKMADLSTASGRVPVMLPCDGTAAKWLATLTGSFRQVESEALDAACLGGIVEYLREHPDVQVDAFVSQADVRDYLLAEKRADGLSNLRVIGVGLEDAPPPPPAP